MKKLWKIIVGFLLVGCIGGLAWVVRTDTHFFKVEETPTQLNFPAGHIGLGATLKEPVHRIVNKIKDKNIWSVDLRALQKELVSHVWIRNVEMRRQLPNKVALSLDLEEVIFHWKKEGKLVPVIRGGKVLNLPEAASFFPNRPILEESDLEVDSAQLEKWVNLYKEIPNIGLLKKSNISSVRFMRNEGVTLNFLDRKTTVHLGWKGISTKGLQILKVQEYLESQNQKARVIDGSFNKKVLVRLRKRS